MNLEQLRTAGLCYLATPYSKFPAGIDNAFKVACRLTAELIRVGIKVYSPIAHTHPIALYGQIDPLDHDIWMPFDTAMMDKADALLIAQMESWEISKGIAIEVDYFLLNGKPIFYLNPQSLHVERAPGFRAARELGAA